MSFSRPDSPPPRQPSPDILPAPLPHPRRVPSPPRIRVHSPPRRTLHAVRSMDLASERVSIVDDVDGASFHSVPWARQRTQSTYTTRSTPHSSLTSSIPSPVGHSRTPSVAIPSPVPSPTPTMVSAPLSKSSIVVLTSPNDIACPRPVALKPIVFDQQEGLGIANKRPSPAFRQKHSKSSLKSVPPLEKHKNVGIACLRFFGIKSQSKQPPRDVVAL